MIMTGAHSVKGLQNQKPRQRDGVTGHKSRSHGHVRTPNRSPAPVDLGSRDELANTASAHDNRRRKRTITEDSTTEDEAEQAISPSQIPVKAVSTAHFVCDSHINMAETIARASQNRIPSLLLPRDRSSRLLSSSLPPSL